MSWVAIPLELAAWHPAATTPTTAAHNAAPRSPRVPLIASSRFRARISRVLRYGVAHRVPGELAAVVVDGVGGLGLAHRRVGKPLDPAGDGHIGGVGQGRVRERHARAV